ncbi:MAG: hypothetical protein EOO48_01510 [Flavobacterium sp.]|nr:MAG: hypothetical protein EOO48_01510 [Flavobacterium sp.]
MKKIFLPLFVLLLLIAACSKEASFPNLDTLNSQTEAYKQNKVSAYVAYSNPGRADGFKDSVLINEAGLPTVHFTSFLAESGKTRQRKTTITYDSIYRATEYSSDGEFPFKMKMKYKKDDKHKTVTAVAGTRSMHFQFDDDFKNIMRTYAMDNRSPDTVNELYYKYSNGKLITILEKSNNKLIPQTEFEYNSEQKLKLVRTKKEITYVSEKTGLIDSTSRKKRYKYYFR